MNSSYTFKQNCGRVEMILGCMFSGKSTELIQRIRKHNIIDNSVCVISYSKDNRYGEDAIISHDKLEYEAYVCEKLFDFYEDNKEIVNNSHIICIEEGQFYDDLFDFVKFCADELKKCVIISALDGDYNREPFENIMKLIPHAESIVKLSALCINCKDGTKANYSLRLVANEKRELIGGADIYSPVCRYHYLEYTENKKETTKLTEEIFQGTAF